MAPGSRRVAPIGYGVTTGQGVAPEEVHVTRPWIAGLMVPAAPSQSARSFAIRLRVTMRDATFG